ncbi:hypothetical protein FOMPIDRAFT_1019809 [Fomitopsis schrenkii]|uniref:Uncharacterized protein n=1 Tax=Fomitopsis schrenkii TaxID=2126942 RepID=S8DN44_FOMSC|nr:hypothetical protein FOMPIDRAFT_1019809 [Fomitopsis schrenkii]
MLGVGDLCILSPKRNVWDEHAPDFWPAPFIPGPGRKLPTPTQAIATLNPLVAPTPNVVPLPPVEPTAQETADGAAAVRVEATAFVPIGALETTSQNVEGCFNMTPSLKQEQITIAMPLQLSAAGSKVARSGGEATSAGQMAAPSEPAVADTAPVKEAPEFVGGLIGDEGAAAPGYQRRRGKRGGINYRRRRARQRAAGGQE